MSARDRGAGRAARPEEWRVVGAAPVDRPRPGARARHRRPDPGAAPGNVTGSAGWAGVDAAVGWRTDTGPYGYWQRDIGPRPAVPRAVPGAAPSPGPDQRPDTGQSPGWDWWNDTGTGEWPSSEWTRVGRVAPGQQWRTDTDTAGRDRRADAGTAGRDRRVGTGTGTAGRDRREDTGTAARDGRGDTGTGTAGRDRRADTGTAARDRRVDTSAAGRDRRADTGTAARDWRVDTGTAGRDRRVDASATARGSPPDPSTRPDPGAGAAGALRADRSGAAWTWRTDSGAGLGLRPGPGAGAAGPGAVAERDWRSDTGTTEWPTSEWTRVGRSAAGYRTPAAPGERPRAVHRAGSARRSAPPAGLPRLLAGVRPDGRAVTLEEHLRQYGALPRPNRGDPDLRLLRLIGDSRLRGRGGAGFPVEAKVRAVLAARGRPVVVVNGAAGDPLSEKDAFLLTRLPHLILDGAQVAAAAVDARQILLYVVGRPQVYGAAERAVTERRRARLDAVPVRLVPAPDRYVAGESSAAAHHLSGGPALPLFQPPHTAEHGVKGRPTLVQNVETLANLALLARYGPGWFRGVGTAAEPGSLVITVRGAVPRPVVVEVPVGTTVEQALAGAGWLTEAIGAVQVGGCFGRWLPASVALSAPLSHAGMLGVGGTLGAGVVIALPDRACGLEETAGLARYLADESAGQCGACVNGLPAIAGALTALAQCRADGPTVQRLYRWCGMVAGRGACRHPDGVAGLVASALGVFAEEVGRHLAGRCSRPLRGVLPALPPGQPPRRREVRA